MRRVEPGRPRLGPRHGQRDHPQEAGPYERAVSFTKGCYVGQETVARLYYRGKPNRHLRGFALRCPRRPRHPLMLGEKQVGTWARPASRPGWAPRTGARPPRGRARLVLMGDGDAGRRWSSSLPPAEGCTLEACATAGSRLRSR